MKKSPSKLLMCHSPLNCAADLLVAVKFSNFCQQNQSNTVHRSVYWTLTSPWKLITVTITRARFGVPSRRNLVTSRLCFSIQDHIHSRLLDFRLIILPDYCINVALNYRIFPQARSWPSGLTQQFGNNRNSQWLLRCHLLPLWLLHGCSDISSEWLLL